MISCAETHPHQLAHLHVLGIRDNKYPGHGHLNYPSSTRSPPARYAIFIMIIPFFEGTRLSAALYTATAYAIGELGADIIRNCVDF